MRHYNAISSKKMTWSTITKALRKTRGSKNRVPHAYVLRKNKDVTRLRPIVSYFHHPIKAVFNRASRALLYILHNSKANHFVLPRTQDLVPVLSARLQADRSAFSKAGISFAPGDIKEMYTALPHADILKAIKWLFSMSRSRTRYISVPINTKGTPHYGKPSSKDMIAMSFDLLQSIVEFDLQHSIFSLGRSTLLRQHIGIGMGSPLSPALAIIVCAYYEHMFLARPATKAVLDNNPVRLSCVRYVDDTFPTCTFDSSIPSARTAAEEVLHLYNTTCYHKDMLVELEPVSLDTPVVFLGTEVTISDSSDPVTFALHSKNSDSIVNSGTQRIFSMHDYRSNVPASQKIGTAISLLYRAYRCSSHHSTFFISMRDAVNELLVLHYPIPVIRAVIARVRAALPRSPAADAAWSGILVHLFAQFPWSKFGFQPFFVRNN
jgi:hypothetical protein